MIKTANVSGIPVFWTEPGPETDRKLVIWLPGFSGTKESVREHLVELSAAGYVAVSFDPSEHGERAVEPVEELVSRVRGNIRRYFWPILGQTCEDTAVIVDWAVEELGVAPRIGMGGISMGGDIAVAAAGIERRIEAVAAAIATPDWLRPGSFEPPGSPDAAAQVWYDRHNPISHPNAYTHAPAISFQCGAEDRQVPPDGAQRFVEALRGSYGARSDRLEVSLEPNTGHSFTPTMWQNSLRWFDRFV